MVSVQFTVTGRDRVKSAAGPKVPCGSAVVFRSADRAAITCSRRDRKDRVEIALEFPSISSPEIPKSCWPAGTRSQHVLSSALRLRYLLALWASPVVSRSVGVPTRSSALTAAQRS
jgi:hypothetical protein